MNPLSFSVNGLHVLISGGCGGIGSAFANAFLLNGAQVTVTDLQPLPDDLIQAGVRYEQLDVKITDVDSGFLVGTIFLIEPLGSATLLTVFMGQEKLIVSVIGDSDFVLNDQVGLSWNLTDQHLFKSENGLRIS